MEWLVVCIYAGALFFIFLFSLGQLHLTWYYWKSKKSPAPVPQLKTFPQVTIQLPIFNEKYVVERLIDSIAELDYPKDKMEIHVLDDSTDETIELIAKKVEEFSNQGFDIKQIRRKNREGFKAGALKYGMKLAKGEFLAIFDADFLPKKDFLKKTLAYFEDSNTGVVQTRWGHVNQDYSLLTRLQAFGLDAHFTIEQTGRSHAGSFINFNGTAGVWRKSCIENAGGWSADTLTEDLDLSYRAQLKGWKFKFLEDVVAPGELPVIMPAIKSQQYRWNKGAAETARKNLGNVLTSNIGLTHKIHAVLHLFNSSVFLMLLTAAILSIPMLFIKASHPELDILFNMGSIFLIGFFSIGLFYWTSSKAIKGKKSGMYFLKSFPVFLTFSMGLSLHNTMAVSEGLLGYKTPFIRTPKFNIFKKGEQWKNNEYYRPKISIPTILEGILCLYFISGVVAGFILKDYGLIAFHIMLALGFGGIFIHTVKPMSNA
ncbi:cellulose synthase family protein [Reichenbachiella sp. MALMAid0571]|uniref:cellulose synthase family protein n=1 Tax=Reichenbachiella sp. MALMAid0571 TaxID=3143939 RepID=UPI0032DEA9F0